MMTGPDLAAIVESAATLMLGLELGDFVEEQPGSSCSFCASVQFMGDWNGAIVVGCDDKFARDTAAAMFGSDAESVEEEEVSDAIGELTNMLAGNVKPLLEGASAISLPTVVYGSSVHLDVPGTELRVGVAYQRGDSVVTVRIYEQAP